MTGIHFRVVDRRAIRRSVHIGDERTAQGRLRQKNGGEASEKKSDGVAENRHRGSNRVVEMESPDKAASAARRSPVENHYVALYPECKGTGVAMDAKQKPGQKVRRTNLAATCRPDCIAFLLRRRWSGVRVSQNVGFVLTGGPVKASLPECMVHRLNAREKWMNEGKSASMYPAFGWR